MVGSVGSGLSSAAQAVSNAITPGTGVSAPLDAAMSATKKAQGLTEMIGSIITDYQPLETSGPRGTRVNLLA
ncbi:hypothetical protein SAMN02744133_10114 [Thalassospira xiamenensis M-5 = DSM 17429]|nr:hypothetical protein SAMN02744133_10114 [Thalassospira xiamenensis M-5 = DSM 17429]